MVTMIAKRSRAMLPLVRSLPHLLENNVLMIPSWCVCITVIYRKIEPHILARSSYERTLIVKERLTFLSLMQSQQTSLGKRKRNWGHPKPRQGRTPGPPFPSTSRDFALIKLSLDPSSEV